MTAGRAESMHGSTGAQKKERQPRPARYRSDFFGRAGQAPSKPCCCCCGQTLFVLCVVLTRAACATRGGAGRSGAGRGGATGFDRDQPAIARCQRPSAFAEVALPRRRLGDDRMKLTPELLQRRGLLRSRCRCLTQRLGGTVGGSGGSASGIRRPPVDPSSGSTHGHGSHEAPNSLPGSAAGQPGCAAPARRRSRRVSGADREHVVRLRLDLHATTFGPRAARWGVHAVAVATTAAGMRSLATGSGRGFASG